MSSAGARQILLIWRQLPYSERVIKEAMRLYPPVWISNAPSNGRCDVDGYTIPKNSVIFISPYVLHHDPRFFDEPEEFKPERWENDFEKTLPRYAYFPFGGGRASASATLCDDGSAAGAGSDCAAASDAGRPKS